MRYLILAPIAVLLTGCMVGPNYQKPAITLPTQFRGAAPSDTTDKSIAETKWQDLFNDPVLQKLIETALTQNFDIQIAAERVQQARAQFDAQRAHHFPSVSGSADYTVARGSAIGATPGIPPGEAGSDLSISYGQLGVGASWGSISLGPAQASGTKQRARGFSLLGRNR